MPIFTLVYADSFFVKGVLTFPEGKKKTYNRKPTCSGTGG